MKLYDIPDSKVTAMGEYMPGILGIEQNEKILYTVITDKFEGYMLFAFENGKMAKVELSNYETKSNRKKLIGAYSDKSPIVGIIHMMEDCDVIAMSDNNRVVCVNTAKIPLKATKNTQGVQVVSLKKKGAKLTQAKLASESGFLEPKKYAIRNIPSAGSILKKEDVQISLI